VSHHNPIAPGCRSSGVHTLDIVAAWQKGAISRETMFDLFRRGEVLPAGRTDEEEARLTVGRQSAECRMQNKGVMEG
jgi:hypothetical protein